jgi:hypothetical protein
MSETSKPKRKASFMELNSNPFEVKETATKGKGKGMEAPAEFESLADTVKIERIDFDNIMSVLEGEDSNEMRIKTLHIMKTPYLFTSEQLIALLHITPSVKTRITFIEEIGPRLTDPKAKSTHIIELFRYSEEKRQVEEVLKTRAQTVTKQSTFSRGKSQSVLNSGGGGRGGRGAGGRGGGRGGGGGGRGMSKAASMATMGSATPSTPATGGGGGRGAGRGGAGRGAGRGGRGAASTPAPAAPAPVSTPDPTPVSTPAPTPAVTYTPPPSSFASTPTASSPPSSSSTSSSSSSSDSKEESKAEELPATPAWTPPPRRNSFFSPEISDMMAPRKSMEQRKSIEVKPIAMKKRFSSRTSLHTSNSLTNIGETVNEDNENSDGEEEGGDEERYEMSAVKESDETSEEDSHSASNSTSAPTPTPPVPGIAPPAPPPTTRRVKPERRASSFCATNSVMAALGFEDLNVLTTDDIGRESWDIKADKDSKNIPTEEGASKLKDLAATTRAKEDKIIEKNVQIDDNKEEEDFDKEEVALAAGMRGSEEFRNDPSVSQVKPNRVSLQELQERRRVIKVKKMWEKGIKSGDIDPSSKPNVDFKPLRVTNRRKSTRLIAEEERMVQYACSEAEGPIGVDKDTGRYA